MFTPARGSPREIFPLGRLFSHRSASMNAAGPRAASVRLRPSDVVEEATLQAQRAHALPGHEILEILRSSRFVRGETKSNFN